MSNRWHDIWTEKYDYFLENSNIYRGKSKIIDESVDYYFGIFEYSIFLLNNYNGVCYLGKSEENIAMYLKKLFFSNRINKYDVIKQIILNYYKDLDWNLIIIKMIYPDYYFRFVDMLIRDLKFNDDEVYKIVLMRDSYKDYLIFIIREINNYKKIDINIY